MMEGGGDTSRWLTTAQAAARLGVKPATLYAYVSRGLLHPRRAPDGRSSRFDPAEIAQVSAHGRRGAPARDGLVIESSLTAIHDGTLFYRGLPAVDLARTRTFEDVAELLWTGAFPARARWAAAPQSRTAATATALLSADALPLDRLRLAAAALAARRHPDMDGAALLSSTRTHARDLIATLVSALSPVALHNYLPDDAAPASLAERLWPRLCPVTPSAAQVHALNAAMVLLADHEITASTLAARAAASVRADLAAVVSAGLAVAGGAWHAGVSLAVERLLDEAGRQGDPSAAVAERTRRGGRLPGFGHPLYPRGDPRATALLSVLDEAFSGASLESVRAVLHAAHRRGVPPPNVDFALAALAHAAGMIPGAAEAIFALARSAGWIAHAFEEYARGQVLRPRAVSTGPRQ